MRPLVTFFLITLLAAQFEYVTDAGVFLGDADASRSVSVHDHGDDHPGHAGEHDGCDHCCHGAGHLTAIAVTVVPATTVSAGAYRPGPPDGGPSRALIPPLRPPIA